MCGIAGFYHPQNIFQGNEKYYHKILQQMMNSLYHRGPDQQETALFDNCGMAHTRLSIVDLENGRQPMSRSIEGHRFQEKPDTGHFLRHRDSAPFLSCFWTQFYKRSGRNFFLCCL